MNIWRKIVIALFIVITSIILCMDIIFTQNFEQSFSNIIHCIAEGIIILMISKEIRG